MILKKRDLKSQDKEKNITSASKQSVQESIQKNEKFESLLKTIQDKIKGNSSLTGKEEV
jgi:hypothetical protein